MIDHARRRAAQEAISNVQFEQVDAQVYAFEPAAFDVAISRTGAMFFGDIVAAFTNIGRALRPSGRLTLLTWQPLPNNEWIRELSTALAAGRDLPAPPPEAPSPFALADPDRVRSVLTSAGFADIELDGTTARMWFGNDPTTPSSSCSACSAGCSKASTTAAATAPSRLCVRQSTRTTTSAAGFASTQRRGSSERRGRDGHRQPRARPLPPSRRRP